MRYLALRKGFLLAPAVVLMGTAFLVYGWIQNPLEQEVTAVIISPSSIGEVSFPHRFHIEDLEFECETCHHETNAAVLRMPHDDYFDDFWIDCRICHRGEGEVVSQAQSCANCHHDSPTGIADETLSSKVVIHKNCWGCHELGNGEEASRGCKGCHMSPQPH